MRMRKKTWAPEMIASRDDCVIFNPEELKGNWSHFNYEKIVLEIGSGKGDYWINMAHKYPDELWIGVEKEISCAGIALKKSIDRTTNNMKFIVNDATNVSLWFSENEVDRIHLNFSDPWPKKHHSKRRLTYGKFLDQYRSILKKDGLIIQKTDNLELFEFSCQSFLENGWQLMEKDLDFRNKVHEEDAITEYEKNFIDKGQPIYRAVWKVNK